MITNNDKRLPEILRALKQVIDPEIGLNIVDLGLIYQVDIDEEKNIIYITMTLTSRFCPMGESILYSVNKVIEDSFTFSKTDISLTFEPPWKPDLITPEGEKYLNNNDA